MNSRHLLATAALALLGAVSLRAAPQVSVHDDAIVGSGAPSTLSEFGFFADPARQRPAPGVHPYRLETPLYSDGAEKLRFVYVPSGETIGTAGEGLLQFPVGSALIKTFAFGKGADRRLIETRVLLHRADGWVALPYVWNEAQTEARLAVAGLRTPVTTPSGETIDYRVPNKNQCKECHGLDGAVTPIGPKARNLSEDFLVGLRDAGLIVVLPGGFARLPRWEDRSLADSAAVARGYLDVNCAHCHQPGATASNSGLDLRWEQSDPRAIGIGKRPVAAGRGAGGLAFDIVPGHPDQSILVYRMESLEGGVVMPELGKATVDQEGVAAVRHWIAEMNR